ncbi:hypothetical protein BaRGS_00010136 [Batillaria attramentaria]|uniref:Calcineurin-like phosphoesterase domain-containing protein n=1 Tax=Batillaria attramentaria TaxID=370345 RepID=A0ABD0LG51_9CAEN
MASKSKRKCSEDRVEVFDDRKPLQMSHMHHDFILENIIGDQMVACPYRTTGCEVVLQLQLLSSHVKSCDFNPSNQPEFIRRSVLSSAENTPSPSHDDLDLQDMMPSPGKPSLMLRLFKSDNRRETGAWKDVTDFETVLKVGMALRWRGFVLRRLRNVSLRSVTLMLIFGVIFTNEYLVYWVQSLRWPALPVQSRDTNEEVVVLLVSDPQLIGIQDEHGFPIGTITRWDSDRFLRKTFSLAYSYARPDVVVFLGDLMDEGSKATRSEYESYLSRFHSIFYPIRDSKVVYVPGDNDIGGEGVDFRTPFKISRFERHFANLTGVVSAFFIDFLMLDFRSQYDSPVEKKHAFTEMAHQLKAPIRVVVNHESVISKMKMLVYPMLKLVQPNLIFSGHWHESFHYVCETCLSSNEDMDHWPVHLRDLRNLHSFTDVDFTNLLAVNEVMVPTCSYRMGTTTMGYGVAVFKRSGSMQYSILWLPSRYLQLYVYLGAMLTLPFVVCLLYIFIFVDRPHHRWQR